jgi:hypothetical protein
MMLRLKQGGQIRTLVLLAFPKTSWKRLLAFVISIIIQPIFVNVIASLGERAAGSKKRKDLWLRSANIGALHSVSVQAL